MTTKTPRKQVSDGFWSGRLGNARQFHQAARDLHDLSEPGRNANATIIQVVHAAIAYADAVTARRGRVVNQQDHAMIGRLLRDVLGNRLPQKQLNNVSAIVATRDLVSYGARASTYDEAASLLARLDEFARWVEDELASN